jgi:hypothetical protein
MKFAYARTGGPLLNWSGSTPPSPTRAGETRSLGSSDIPRAGAPEVISGYESPEPGAATIHLGGYMPEGAARAYGQTTIGATEAPPLDLAGIARKAGIIASAYHGVKRNNGSITSGLLWALAAWAVFPFHGAIVPAIAIAQGFAQPKLHSNPARRRRTAGTKTRARRLRGLKRRRNMRRRKKYREEIARTKKYKRTIPGRLSRRRTNRY